MAIAFRASTMLHVKDDSRIVSGLDGKIITAVPIPPRTPTTGQLINKLEKSLALAIANGDKEAEERLRKALETAINSTQMPEVLA